MSPRFNNYDYQLAQSRQPEEKDPGPAPKIEELVKLEEPEPEEPDFEVRLLPMRLEALEQAIAGVDRELDRLHAALNPVLIRDPDDRVSAAGEPIFEPRSDLSAFFTYATGRVRELRDRVAFITEQVDL